MGQWTDRIKRAEQQIATTNDSGAVAMQVDPREQAIVDRYKSKSPGGSYMQRIAEAEASAEIEARKQQRAYAEQAPLNVTQPAREMISNLGDRNKVLGVLRQMTPEQREEALRLAPGIAQQLGDNRGGAVGRTLGAVSRGISHGVVQPAVELAGQLTGTDLGGSTEEIEFIRQLDAAASQEFSPARPGDPWYQTGPLQAMEMAPWMATTVGGAGLGRAAATGVAGRVAAGAAAGGKTAGRIQAAGQAVGNAPRAIGLPALTAGKAGELAGITAAAFPSMYAQEVDQLKAIGMEDNLTLRLLAGGTAAIGGLVEGIVPNPFKAGEVSLTDGALKAARQYLWEAAKQFPGELSEEAIQGVVSGLGQHVAQYLDENAEDKTIADAFVNGWEQGKEAALPMAFLLGTPAVGGAGLSAVRAQRLKRLQDIRAKGFVSAEEAKELGYEGDDLKNRKQRQAKADAEIAELEQEAAQGSKAPWYDFGTGEPQGDIPAPPGLGLLDRLRGTSAELKPPATPPPPVVPKDSGTTALGTPPVARTATPPPVTGSSGATQVTPPPLPAKPPLPNESQTETTQRAPRWREEPEADASQTAESLELELAALAGKNHGRKARKLPDGTVIPPERPQLLTPEEQSRFNALPGLISEARKREETQNASQVRTNEEGVQAQGNTAQGGQVRQAPQGESQADGTQVPVKRPPKPQGADVTWDDQIGAWTRSNSVFDQQANGWRMKTAEEGFTPTQAAQNQPGEPQVPAGSTFDEYLNEWNQDYAKRMNKPVPAITDESRKRAEESIGRLADQAIKQGRVSKFASDNAKLDELQLREVQNAVRSKGYEVGEVRRSTEKGVDYMAFSVTKKAPQATPAPIATQKQPEQTPKSDDELMADWRAANPPPRYSEPRPAGIGWDERAKWLETYHAELEKRRSAETAATQATQKQPEQTERQPAPQPQPKQSDPATSGWDVVKDKDGKLVRMDPDPNLRPSQRIATAVPVDPSEGVVLITKDQFGKSIPPETMKARQEFVEKAKPGALLNIKGFETSGPYRVMADGTLLDTATSRSMADVQTRANMVQPGDITWIKAAPAVPGPSEATGAKPEAGSPTVSPDAPKTSETSKGKAAGEGQPSEASTELKKRGGRTDEPGQIPRVKVAAEGPTGWRAVKAKDDDGWDIFNQSGEELGVPGFGETEAEAIADAIKTMRQSGVDVTEADGVLEQIDDFTWESGTARIGKDPEDGLYYPSVMAKNGTDKAPLSGFQTLEEAKEWLAKANAPRDPSRKPTPMQIETEEYHKFKSAERDRLLAQGVSKLDAHSRSHWVAEGHMRKAELGLTTDSEIRAWAKAKNIAAAGQQPAGTPTATEEPADADMAAMMKRLVDEMDAPSKSKKKTPSSAKPRKYQEPKTPAKPKATAAEKRAQASQAIRNALKGLDGSSPTSGLDPKVGIEVLKAIKLYIEAEIIDFKSFIESLVEDLGESWLKGKERYLEAGWQAASDKGWVDSPAGKVADVLPAPKVEAPVEIRPLKKDEVRPRVEGQTWDEVGTGETSESIKEQVPGLEVDPLAIRGTHDLVEKIVFDVKEINSRRLAARKRRQRIEREKSPLFSDEIASQQEDPLEELKAIDAKTNQNREFYDEATRNHWMDQLRSLAELPADEQRKFVTFWNNSSYPRSWANFAGILNKWKSGKIDTAAVVDRSAIPDPAVRARVEKLDKTWTTLKDIERRAGDPQVARERLQEEEAKYAELGFEPPQYESKEKTFAEAQAEKEAARKAQDEEAKKQILPGLTADKDELSEVASNARELESLKPIVNSAMNRFFEEADNYDNRNEEAMEKAQDELEDLDRQIAKLSYGALDAQSLLDVETVAGIEAAINETLKSKKESAKAREQEKQSQQQAQEKRQREAEAKKAEAKAEEERKERESQERIEQLQSFLEPQDKPGNWDVERESQMRLLSQQNPPEFRRHISQASQEAYVLDNYDLTKNVFAGGGSSWSARRKNTAVKDYTLSPGDTKAKAIDRIAWEADQAVVATYSKLKSKVVEPQDKLKQAGLKVEQAGSHWIVSGKTFDNKQIIKDVGGKYDANEKNWWFSSDPTDAIRARLSDRGDEQQPSDGGDSDANVERKRVRAQEAERADERGTSASAVKSVGDDTKQLIQRGGNYGIPDRVLSGQVEDIGRVAQAFEAGKPMFLVGSAPGMGKSFILGGSIAEIRKRINKTGGTPRFIYVTENQELISQLKRDLADYGVSDVEFVTYAGVRGKRPNASGAVVMIDEAHNAKNLTTKNGEAIKAMVRESDFAVYATATPFENVAEAKYLEASGIFDGVEAVIKRKDDRGRPYQQTVAGFDAWAFAYGAELYFPKNAPRPVVYWHKHTTAEEGQIQANEWMAARGVYTQRPMVLPPEIVKSDLRAVTVDAEYAQAFEDVLGAYAEAEAIAENGGEAGMIRAHGINLQKRILEASKVKEGISRAEQLIEDGKQVIIFVNTKADRAVGRYMLSEPYRKHHGIKGEAAKALYTPSQIASMMADHERSKRMARQTGGNAGPSPFAKPIATIAKAMGNRGIDFSLPSVADELLAAFPDGQSVEYTGRLADAKAKENLAQWKSGKAKVIVATMDKGGTGLSYHDTTGRMPERVQVNINLPWSGTQVEQVSGRLARLGTAKPVGIEWIFADNIPFERELSKTVGSRMRSMQAAVQGSLGDIAQSIKDFEFGDAPSAPDLQEDATSGMHYPDGSAYREWMDRKHRIGDTPTSYLSGHSSGKVREAAKENPGLGLVITPSNVSYVNHGGDYSHIMIDNGAFSEFTGNAPFSEEKFFALLDKVAAAGLQDKVQFVVVPDKVGDWKGTNERWEEFNERVRAYGMPLAYVGQDGIEQHVDQIPWDDFDVFFIGGSTPWKLGYDPKGAYEDFNRPTDAELMKAGYLKAQGDLIKEAQRRGKRVHMGRVNSWKRMEVANYGVQVDSTDGNFIGAAPDNNLPIVMSWLEGTGGDAFRDRIQQIQDTFPLNREQAIVADILFDAMALPGDVEIARPGAPIPADPLTQTQIPLSIAKHLTPTELESLRSDVVDDIVTHFESFPPDVEFEEAAKAGIAKRGWYKRAAESLSQIFGGDAPTFVSLLAATSPRQGVTENLKMTLAIWKAWNEAGRPKNKRQIAKVLRPIPGAMFGSRLPNTIRALQGQRKLSGYKVSAFAENLIGNFEEVTNDAWMATFAGIDQKIFGTKAGYLAFSAKVRRIAKKLDMSPAEVQETIWAFTKTLSALRTGGRTSQEALAGMTHEAVASMPEFAELITGNEDVRKALKELGLEEAVSRIASEQAEGTAEVSGAIASDRPRVLGRIARRIPGGQGGRGAPQAVARSGVAPDTLYQASGIDADSIPTAVLDKMSRRLKAMGYDSRGAEDVRRAIKERGLLDFNPDWVAAYQFATGAEQSRQEKAVAKKDLKNVNWERLRELGTTADPREAGYIRPDGTLADLSGKREGGSPGMRSYDHREAGGTAGMQEIMAYGWVRMDENSGMIDIAKLPTSQQMSAISKMAERKNGEIVVDLADGLGEWSEGNEYYSTPSRRWSQEYPKGTSPRRIANDIKKFFSGDTPNTLRQQQLDPQGTIQAWTHFAGASKALIGATDQADVSSFFHELWHPVRRFLFNSNVSQEERGNITDEDIRTIEEFVGVEYDADGQAIWNREAEERFVDAGMTFMLEGEAPTPELKTVFQKIAQWLADVVSVIARRVNLTDEVRDVLGKVFSRGQIAPEKLQALKEALASSPPAESVARPEPGDAIDDSLDDFFGEIAPSQARLEAVAKLDAAGIKIKQTNKGWSVTGLPSDLSQEMHDGIKADGGRRTDYGYFFKENPTSRLVGVAEEIANANSESDEAAAAGMVSTPIGILNQEDADWYNGEYQQRLELARQMLNEENAAIDELLSQFVGNRGLFKIELNRAAEKNDPSVIVGFDKLVEYSVNHPELGLPQDEQGLFERLRQPAMQEKELIQEINDDLAAQLASEEGDDSFDFGEPETPQARQSAIEGFEDDVARLERKDIHEAKRAKLKEGIIETKGKQRTFLTDIYGDPNQGTLFDTDGIADSDSDTLFQASESPERRAARILKSAIENGADTFEGYIAHAREQLRDDQIRQSAAIFEQTWDRLRTRDAFTYLGPAGKVADMLPEQPSAAKPEASKPKQPRKPQPKQPPVPPPLPPRIGPRVAGVRQPGQPFPDRQVEREPYTDHELTGMAKAVMNDLRELGGIPELQVAPPETIEQWAIDAQTAINADKNAPSRLLNEIIANPARALDHHDVMLLAFRYRELANQAEPHFQEVLDASKSGDDARIAKARTNYILARQPMTDFEELTLKAKSTWGRTGIALQVMLRKDNTVAGLLRRAREANHGKQLTPEQEIEMRELAGRFAEIQKKLDEETARADKAEAEVASLRHLKNLIKESPTRRKPSKQQKTELDKAWGEIARLANVDLLFQRDESNPYHNTVQVYRELGVETFAELRRHVEERLGKEQASQLEQQFRQAWEATKPDTEVPANIDRGDLAQLTREARMIERSIVEGLMLDHSAEAVLEMRDQIVDAVHAEMQELLEDESFTRRQTMDALSAYGQFSRPSQDTTDTLLRNLNAEVLKLRQIDQLGDAVARTEQLRTEGKTDAEISDILIKERLLVAPTGLVRDTPTDTLRELSRQYSELKKEIPASSEGRAGLLQTAVAAIERGLTNRIRDLNRAITNQEPIKIGRKASPTNEKIERLKQERDTLLKEYRKLFPAEKKSLTPEQRLSNAIKAAERSIAVIQAQIKSRNFDKAKPEALPDSPELQALKQRLQQLQAQRKAAKALELSAWEGEGGAMGASKSPQTMSEVEKQQRRAQRAIEQIQKKLKDLKDGKETVKEKRPDLLEPELRRQLDAWRDRLKAAKQATKEAGLSAWEGEGGTVIDPKEAAYRKAYIASLRNRIAKLQEFMREGDFSPKEKKLPRVLSKAELDLKRKLAELNTEKLQKMAEYHLSNLKGLPWLADKVSEVLHLARAIETSWDLSAAGRQGGLIALAHPSLATNALVGVMKSMAQAFDKGTMLNKQEFKWSDLEQFLTGIDSQKAELAFMHQLTDGEWGEFRQLAGLDLPSTDQAITRQEEVFQGRWGKFVPGVAISSRLYTMTLNKMRADMFDLMVESLSRQGKPTIEEAKLIASFVNVATGRADFKQFNSKAAALNTIFFAPRYVASRFQYIAMPFYLPFKGGLKDHWQVKRAIYGEYARTARGAALVLGLVALVGQLFWDDDDENKPTVELDPTSSDFLKPKIGETRYDFLAGLQQGFVLSARMAPEELGGGRIGDRKFGEGGPYAQNRATVAARFLRTKLAPGPGYFVTALNDWENVVGNKADSVFGLKVHPAIGTTAQLFFPLSMESITDAFETQGVPAATASSILATLGVGMSTYGPKTEYMTGTPEERQEQIEKDLEKFEWDSPDPPYAEFLTQEQMTQFADRKHYRYGAKVYDATGSSENEDATARREEAVAAIRSSGFTYDEAKQALIDYWAKRYGSAYENRRMKSKLVERIYELRAIYRSAE